MRYEIMTIITECKSQPDDDWRSFLQFKRPNSNTIYEIRGYGLTPIESLGDVLLRFNTEDPVENADNKWQE